MSDTPEIDETQVEGPTPPKRPFEIEVRLHADDHEHAARLLEQIAWDMQIGRRVPTNLASSSGYQVLSFRNEGGLTGDEYDAALMAWFDETRKRS